jgi:hypothetical protein
MCKFYVARREWGAYRLVDGRQRDSPAVSVGCWRLITVALMPSLPVSSLLTISSTSFENVKVCKLVILFVVVVVILCFPSSCGAGEGTTATRIPLGTILSLAFRALGMDGLCFNRKKNKIFIETVMYKCISSVVINAGDDHVKTKMYFLFASVCVLNDYVILCHA